MTKDAIICPICGSEQINRFEEQKSDSLTLGSVFTFTEVFYKCNTCNEEIDLFAETDKHYLAAQKDAENILLKHIIEKLSETGISMASFERAFELPIRTLTRWKNGEFSASAIALLRIAITYPWIIGIAEHKFEETFARNALINAALTEFNQAAQPVSNSTISNVIRAKFDSSTSSSTVAPPEPRVSYSLHQAGG